MNDKVIRKLAKENGMSEELARKVFTYFSDYRLEHGDAAYRKLLDDIRKLGEEADSDGVPVSALLAAKIRRPS
jgi:hypothetical protein